MYFRKTKKKIVEQIQICRLCTTLSTERHNVADLLKRLIDFFNIGIVEIFQ